MTLQQDPSEAGAAGERQSSKEHATVCPKCLGDRQIANDDEGTPWSAWENLPPGSDLAVRMGLVFAIPCPLCSKEG